MTTATQTSISVQPPLGMPGQLYSGAQVLNKGTNDPAFNLGQLRP